MDNNEEQIISKQDVSYVASLARLDLNDDELESFTVQLSAVLVHAKDLSSIDLSDLPPTSHPLALKNVFRLDTARESISREEVLSVAPQRTETGFLVPPILGED